MSILIALFVLSFFSTGSVYAEKRVALVIGNSEYKNIPALDNPKNDANLMADTLGELGFQVVLAIDVDSIEMRRAIKKFSRLLRSSGKDAIGLFYYAGHGVQASGNNYLIPLKADILSQSDLSLEAINSDNIFAQMDGAGNNLNIIILDACRNNPFKGSARSASRGLARITKRASGSLIAYSAAPGQIANDGDGKHSPYTQALVTAMLKPGLTVEQVFKQARVNVRRETDNRQTPWEESSLEGDFYFVPSRGNSENVTAPASNTGNAVELAFWNSIQGSNDVKLYREYLRRYNNGAFAIIAKAKLKSLKLEKPPEEFVVEPPEQRFAYALPPSAPVASVPRVASDPEMNSGAIIGSLPTTASALRPAVSPSAFSSTRDLVRAVQGELKRVGCSPGKVDGEWGLNGKSAMRKYNHFARQTLNLEKPDQSAYQAIQKQTSAVCPAGCGVHARLDNGKCVPREPKSVRKTSARKKTPEAGKDCFTFNGKLLCG